MSNIFENQLKDFKDYKIISGTDEAGRGPIAGPLTVASVILKPDVFNPILNDSKKLSESKREILYDWILNNSVDYKIITISPEEIDKQNILVATLTGMKKSIEYLSITPDLCLIDGNKLPDGLKYKAFPIIKGDSLYASIAAASILAKVTRDRIMLELHKKYPQYAFNEHKGYPTKKHLQLIEKFGICEIYRYSYKPVKYLHQNKLF
ncbi:MAG: ribonuclease HII [Candidatus Cloacimonetes bacterium]|jgi:ribonuclease HII|nr:ribonuclease HII [Candidatus Cloacimonadota bacterium]MDD4155264.1 ribonuclease HII [Candidatus Cloacimonadota bacterium]